MRPTKKANVFFKKFTSILVLLNLIIFQNLIFHSAHAAAPVVNTTISVFKT